MYHTINIRMLLKDSIQGAINRDIDIVERRLLPAQELNSIENFLGRVVQVVGDDDFVASFQQSKSGERADVAGASVRPALVWNSPRYRGEQGRTSESKNLD